MCGGGGALPVRAMYRLLMRHIRLTGTPQDKVAWKVEARAAFRTPAPVDSTAPASEYVLAGLQRAWSRISVARMSIPPRLRPTVPDCVRELGTVSVAEGPGRFVVAEGRVTDGEAAQLERAKMYNTALQDSDIRRHIQLNERFHFNGPEREHNRGRRR